MSVAVRSVLICGGCGFMGSHFVRYLYTKYPQYKIYNLDLLTYAGNRENLTDIETMEQRQRESEKRYFFIKGDIGNRLLIDKVFSDYSPDVVINFAAQSHVDRSIINAVEFIRTNVHGAYILLEAARKHKIPRFIYISTDEIYGNIPPGLQTAEDYPLQPTNPYAASKASADLMVQAYIKTHKTPAIILRSSNNYGSHQYPEKLHPLVMTGLIAGHIIPVHGGGGHTRSWLHVSDFCRALDLIMHQSENFKIYNISGEERTTLEVIRTIAEILGKELRKYTRFVNDRPGPDYRYSPDCSLIRQDLGWQRQQSYEKVIKEVVDWYLTNRNWWRKIKNKKGFREYYKKQTSGLYTFEENGD